MSISPQSWGMQWMGLQGALMRGRRAAGLSQETAAERLGVSRRTFQRWEDGTIDPSGPELFRWAALFGLSITFQAAAECASSDAPEAVDAVEPEPVARSRARRRLPSARAIRLRGSTALSTTEQARAYHMLVVEGRTHAAVAATLTADRAHGAAPVSEDEVRALFAAERALHFRDRFHGVPRLSLDGENATDRRSVHGKSPRALSPSRSRAAR